MGNRKARYQSWLSFLRFVRPSSCVSGEACFAINSLTCPTANGFGEKMVGVGAGVSTAGIVVAGGPRIEQTPSQLAPPKPTNPRPSYPGRSDNKDFCPKKRN